MNDIHSKSPIDMGLFHRIDINLYPLFIAIYEQKSISKAAQILSITQSAASHALQRLRSHLKDDLFVRSGSQMLPTPFAEQNYLIIKNALIAIQSISMQQQSFDPNMVQSLKIAIHDEIEPIVFPKLVAHFQKLGLSIQFMSSKLDRKTVDADLVSQQIDFVIDLEQNFGDKIQFESLVKDQFVACTQLQQINAELYLAAPHIGVSSRRTGVLVEDVHLNRHYSTALQILEQYPSAILTIPQNILSHLHVSPLLNIFDVPVKLPQMNIGIYWHKNLMENKRHLFFRNEIYKIFA